MLIVVIMAVLAWAHALALNPSTLYKGSKGDSVKKLQQALIDQGFLSGKADGIFGPKTEQAVIRFQQKNGLPGPDGTAYPRLPAESRRFRPAAGQCRSPKNPA